MLALAPLLLVGIFGRGLWTPDEPREADIAWRMSLQRDRTLPELAGTPFLEKPPLSYWMSAAVVSWLGDSAQALRAPNLLYALIGALSVGALALSLQADATAAAIAALVALSALNAYRVVIWLAPDACLLSGSALALLGVWRGYCSSPGGPKATGYALMHLGAAIGFMAKSAPGWLVPALALLTLIAWERRWSELKRWELYAGFALQVLIIGPWLLAVARSAGGAEALRALFWNNVVGRFTRVASPAALDYTSGHRNFPGKYLFELPLYLLPWTLVVVAALMRAWRRARAPAPAGTPWRFALGASLPFLLLLSVAATARDIYAAPTLLGFGLLTGLWAGEAGHSPERADRLALQSSRTLLAGIAWLLAGALIVFGAAGAGARLACWPTALAVIAAAHLAVWRSGRALRADDLRRAVLWLYAGYVAAVCLAALVTLPIVDRWQDLPALARRIHADTARAPLALLDPDETTIAILDRGLETRFTILTSGPSGAPRVVSEWFSTRGREARVLVLLPGHAPGPLTPYLARLTHWTPPDDGVAGRLVASGTALLARRYELPHGRRYALLAPPP